ncbi:hypothetical protein HF086_014623 [Spodoptera exigua]|uniref:Uncharacterized protein n=1 Tax=Spodoptera exigua TaxID=7107 RepID=A0A922M5P6_SPOEX|nr:hypothetical protein HF086_014623 [Spodoptera exigua]
MTLTSDGLPSATIILVVIPEDVPAGLAAIYGFAPPLHKGVRSTSYRQRFARRRPVFELLVRAGIIKRNYDYNVIKECDDEPR